MRFIPGRFSGRGAALFCCAVTTFLFLLPEAQAKPRHRPPTPFSVALEPFVLARSVVHAAARPIVHNVPRILVATAAAPIKVAYYAPRRLRPRSPRGEQVYDVDEESEVKPIRAAYSRSNRTQSAPSEQDEDNQEQEKS